MIYYDRHHLALPIMEHRIGRTIVRSLASFLKKVERPISTSSEGAASRRVKVCDILYIFVIRAQDLSTDHKQKKHVRMTVNDFQRQPFSADIIINQ